ncbi:MAG: hypothetical protein ACHQ17_11545 [Polyangia bacterium]
MKLPGLDRLGLSRLGNVGWVGERKAISLLCLGFYTTLFFMISLSARTELPEWLPLFIGMTMIYSVAFFAVAAEWFWGRWFAIGLGYWGSTMAVMAFVTTRSLPAAMVIFGLMHGLIAVCLMGEKMATFFDAKPAWREKWKLDEQGVVRVRKSVTRAASSLPALIMFALAPREGANLFAFGAPAFDLTSWVLAGVAVFALVGLLSTRRTLSVLALGAAGLAIGFRAIASGGELFVAHTYLDPAALPHAGCALHMLGVFAAVALVAASLPFAAPMAGFLFRRR